MRKTLTALVAIATLGAAAIAAPTTADARWGWRGGPGPFIGGLAAGAIIGGALAAPYYRGGYYAPGPYYYGAGGPYYSGGGDPRCWQPVWNGWRWVRAWAC
jgi:hypothetical protein